MLSGEHGDLACISVLKDCVMEAVLSSTISGMLAMASSLSSATRGVNIFLFPRDDAALVCRR